MEKGKLLVGTQNRRPENCSKTDAEAGEGEQARETSPRSRRGTERGLSGSKVANQVPVV